MLKQKLKQNFFGFAFALVFLPPKKEMEDWASAYSLKTLPASSFQEKPSTSSSSSAKASDSANGKSKKQNQEPPSTRFSFNGTNTLSFSLKSGQKAEWEVGLPPIEFYKIWDSGAWSGLSFSSHEVHHFYVRELKKGPEPKYRAYVLSPEWEVIDFSPCSKKDIFLLEKNLKSKEGLEYRLTRIKMLSSQELKRDAAWGMRAEAGQEYLKLKSDSCDTLELEGFPKSFRVKL